MKTILSTFILLFSISLSLNAQNLVKKDSLVTVNNSTKTVTVVSLEQTKGEFTQKTVNLEEGDYIFEVSNSNVGHDVGFVLAPKSNPKKHIKTAYVKKHIKNNSTETSNITTLEKGEYVYFCPLNPTPQYTLIVE